MYTRWNQKRSIRKAVLITLLFVLAFTVISPVYGEEQEGKKKLGDYAGTTYLQMPDTEYGGPTTASTIRINRLQIKDHKSELDATVQYEGNSYPIHLTGRLFKTRLQKDERSIFYIDSVDGVFDILHASFDQQAERALIYHGDLKDAPLLSLYIMRKGTREVSFFDIDMSNWDKATKQSIQDEMEAADEKANIEKERKEKNETFDRAEEMVQGARYFNDFWFFRLFKPMDLTQSKKDEVVAAGEQICFDERLLGCVDSDYYYGEQYNAVPSQIVVKYIHWTYEIQRYNNGSGWDGVFKTLEQATKGTWSGYGTTEEHYMIRDIDLSLALGGSDDESNNTGDYFGRYQIMGRVVSGNWNVSETGKAILKAYALKMPKWKDATKDAVIEGLFAANYTVEKKLNEWESITAEESKVGKKIVVKSNEYGLNGGGRFLTLSGQIQDPVAGSNVRLLVNFNIYTKSHWTGRFTVLKEARNLTTARSYYE